ncbi:MAG: 50S ribosomal protein L35 [Bifidobacteriaceae bacterium]|jgi:large subunit ribosomal protein L35|nr:50S ribosomal protein L35 [Bifidobacteriaceae bacterium]
MPKNKPSSAATKRFRVTGSKKIMFNGTKMRHNLEKKSGKKARALQTEQVAHPEDQKVAKKLLGI